MEGLPRRRLWTGSCALLILTGQRRAEMGDLAWTEFDLDKRQIGLPPDPGPRTTARNIIPLCDEAFAILPRACPEIKAATSCSATAPAASPLLERCQGGP